MKMVSSRSVGLLALVAVAVFAVSGASAAESIHPLVGRFGSPA